MGKYIQILTFVVTGAMLLWFGYCFVIGLWVKIRQFRDRPWLIKSVDAGDPQICPICSSKLYRGDLLETSAFPSVTGGRNRIMQIRGCMHCLSGDVERYCPVCGAPLADNDILVARMFERKRNRRAHVHILGCSRCRKLGVM
jgi:hypothetical protein